MRVKLGCPHVCDSAKGRLRHVAYAGGWKKSEPLWDSGDPHPPRVARAAMLEAVLTEFGRRRKTPGAAQPSERMATPMGQETPVPPIPQYP